MDAKLIPTPLSKDDEQLVMEIAGPDDGGAFSKLEGEHKWTAERLLVRKPEIYRAVLRLIARGDFSHLECANTLGISAHSVRAVLKREGIAVALGKERLGHEWADVAGQAARIVNQKLSDPDEVREMSALQVATVGAIATDKSLLLGGDATVRLDHRVTVDGDDPYGAFIASMRPRGTGWGEGNPGQKELGPGMPALPEAGSAPT